MLVWVKAASVRVGRSLTGDSRVRRVDALSSTTCRSAVRISGRRAAYGGEEVLVAVAGVALAQDRAGSDLRGGVRAGGAPVVVGAALHLRSLQWRVR